MKNFLLIAIKSKTDMSGPQKERFTLFLRDRPKLYILFITDLHVYISSYT